MCFRHNWLNEKFDDMSREVFDSITQSVGAIDDLETVMFAGMGEPLIHRNILQMVSKIKTCGKKVSLLTNGTMLDEKMSLGLLNSGLDELWVSVDGFNRQSYEKIQKGAVFDKICKNLYFFSRVKTRCRLGITFVIMRDNLSELKSINRFADDFSADMINLSYCIPSAPVNADLCVYDKMYPVGKMYRVCGAGERIHNSCPFIEDDVCFVRYDGEICPCMQLLHSGSTYFFEEERKMNYYSFGNIKNKSLKDIYNCTEYVQFRDKVHNFQFPDCTLCDGCDDRKSNKKDCMFNEEPTCGACLWAQGIGRCP